MNLLNYLNILQLEIFSAGRNDKYFRIVSSTGIQKFVVEKDILEDLKAVLKDKRISLNDFEDFVAIKSDSFTGYREAATICNMLRHFVKKVAIEDLEYPKYHKEPNINLSKK